MPLKSLKAQLSAPSPGRVIKIAQMGSPVLYQKSQEVEDISAPDIQQSIADLIRTTENLGPAAGLSAPQIGVSLRIFLYEVQKERADTPDIPDGVPPTILINPKITPIGAQKILGWEACFSLPDLAGEVPRFHSVHYTAQKLDGTTITGEAHGHHARVLQHECDHLDGILYPMRMTDMSRLGYRGEIIKHLTTSK